MISETTVYTARATKYLKTLCGHFRLKVDASFDDDIGTVNFSIGHAALRATPEHLSIRLEADSPENMDTLKEVVGGHLERFAAKESIQVSWTDVQSATPA